jgi:hypothetical protein
MSVNVGDIVKLNIIEVAGYACWGISGDQVGFIHCTEWSRKRPIPDEEIPKVGDSLQVRVFRLVDLPQDQLPADVTFDGKFRVDFAGSANLL